MIAASLAREAACSARWVAPIPDRMPRARAICRAATRLSAPTPRRRAIAPAASPIHSPTLLPSLFRIACRQKSKAIRYRPAMRSPSVTVVTCVVGAITWPKGVGRGYPQLRLRFVNPSIATATGPVAPNWSFTMVFDAPKWDFEPLNSISSGRVMLGGPMSGIIMPMSVPRSIAGARPSVNEVVVKRVVSGTRPPITAQTL